MQEHSKDIQKRRPNSNVYMHVQNTGHSFNFEDVSVFDSCSSTMLRKHLESVHSKLHINSINRSITLNQNYVSILNNL